MTQSMIDIIRRNNPKNILVGQSREDVIFWCVTLTFLLLPTGTATPLMGLGLSILVWIFSGKFLETSRIIRQTWFWPVFLFVILPWIGLFWSQNIEIGEDYAMKGKYWIAVLIAASCAIDEKRLYQLVCGLWVGLLAGALLAFFQMTDLVPVIRKGYPGFGIVHTLAAMYLIVGILMASYYFRRTEKKKMKWVYGILILAFLFHLTVFRGRSGYLIFLCVSPIVARDLMYRFPLMVKAAATFVLILFLFMSPVVQKTVSNTSQTLSQNWERALKGENIEEMPRFYIYKHTIDAVKAHPIIGIGTGSLNVFMGPEGQQWNHPHNNILYMGVSFGIAGFIGCLWLFWNMFRLSWKMRHTDLGYFVLVSGVVLFFGGLFDTQILNTGTLLMLAMTYGLLNHLNPETGVKP